MGTLVSGNRAMEFLRKKSGDRGKDASQRVSSLLGRSLDLVPDMVKSQEDQGTTKLCFGRIGPAMCGGEQDGGEREARCDAREQPWWSG